MKKITYAQFLSLVQIASRIVFDDNTVEHFVESDGQVTFYWLAEPEGFDCGECEYEVDISDDKEFFFDSENGAVKFKDSDGIECVVNFYGEFQITKLPNHHVHRKNKCSPKGRKGGW